MPNGNMLAGFRPPDVAGATGRGQQLAAGRFQIDQAMQAEAERQIDRMNAQERELASMRNESIAKRMIPVIQATDPAQAAAAWDQGFTELSQVPGMEGLGQEIGQYSPEKAQQYINEALTLEQALGRGAPVGPRETRTRPEGAERVFEEFDPSTGQWMEVSRGTPTPAAAITIGGEKKFREKFGELQAKRLDKIIATADEAEGTVYEADQFRSLMQDVETGAGTAARLRGAEWLSALGMNPESLIKMEPAQALESISKRLALKLRREMPGQLSDQDIKFLIAASPGLSKSREGNLMLLNAMEAIAQRQMEKSQMAQEYAEENETLRGFDKVWKEYINANPLFSERTGTVEMRSTDEAGNSWVKINGEWYRE